MRYQNSTFYANHKFDDGEPKYASIIKELLAKADIQVNGSRDWDMRIHNPEFYKRVLLRGSIGLGESYMDGWWDVPKLEVFFTKLLLAHVDRNVPGLGKFSHHLFRVWNILVNRQSLSRAFRVGEVHYDIGNELYRAMLDSSMSYSCGYWKDAVDLEQAQQNKLKLVCEKLKLKPGMRLLDIGCGWGGIAEYAVRNYGVEVTGITISKQQKKLAEERVKGLPVEIRLQDYRLLDEKYDRIVSVGMFEHVGAKNYRTYFKKVAEVLDEQGLILLHTIGTEYNNNQPDPWVDKYIFPNGQVPSRIRITSASRDVLRLEDWHNFGPDYDQTLMAWWKNFDAAWVQLKSGFDKRFYRMWKYYLHCCAGYFRSRNGQLWQLVFSHPASTISYHSVR